MATEKLNEIIFYALEKSIKSYRQFAQNRIKAAGFDITIDQWMVLKTLNENSEITQQQIGELVFKDYASITRIIELLVQKHYISRSSHKEDRRRFYLAITAKGKKILQQLQPIINKNRSIALKGISEKDIYTLRAYLDTITSNCTA